MTTITVDDEKKLGVLGDKCQIKFRLDSKTQTLKFWQESSRQRPENSIVRWRSISQMETGRLSLWVMTFINR